MYKRQIIGAATAYFLSKEGRKVKVIERDPTYKTASFPLSLGGFRRQFFPVSYTHLTLPTNREVEISVVDVSLKKKKK